MTGNFQADSTFGSTKEKEEESDAGEFTGFYRKVMQKKRETSEQLFESKPAIDLDEELRKLERIKQQRRTAQEELREQRS